MRPGLNEAAALAQARDLDARLDGDVRHRIGEICGGLSEHGIAADLRAWLDDEEEPVLVECDLSRLREDKAAVWLRLAREQLALEGA